MTVRYVVAKDYPEGTLFREIKGDNQYDCQMWNPSKKEWVYHPDAGGYFLGFNPAKNITEEEAMNIVNGET